MKNKVSKYLSAKDFQSYSQLDLIFKLYVDGALETMLSKNGYTDIEIFASINKTGKNSLQVTFRFFNIITTIDFGNENYSFVTYPLGIQREALDKLFIERPYSKDFSLDNFLSELEPQIKNHKDFSNNQSETKKKKIYGLIATISMCFCLLEIVIFISYIFITGTTIQLDFWWMILLFAIPMILWFVFGIKSKK